MTINLGMKGVGAIRRFEKERGKGSRFFPAFMMISLTSRCNYTCQGCWVGTKEETTLPLTTVLTIINQSKARGSHYFGLMGGEPFLYDGLYEIIDRNRDCYFQIFTNGAFVTEEAAQKLRNAANVTPVISIEGLEDVSDERRRGKNVYASAVAAVKHCVAAGLPTGIATSICRSNFDELVSRDFLKGVVSLGAHYVWYYIYRPVGPDPCPELTLSREHIVKLRRFMVEARTEFPVGIIDTYWDAQGRALCPGAMGLSHHVSPGGYLEFCPPVQFSKDRLTDGLNFADKITCSPFLETLRTRTAQRTRGCIFMEDPAQLHRWMTEQQALDSSGRDMVYEELSRMTPCASHAVTGEAIPEKSVWYRIAKKYWFFGFGAYG